jgi:hypothetical protein
MRALGKIPRLSAARFLSGLLMIASLAGFSCGGGEHAKVNRLVLVFDPTVLRDVNAAEFGRRVGEKLRTSLANLPEATYIDLYFVGLGQAGLPVDFQDSLPFYDNEATNERHLARARALGDTIVKLAEARWAASNEQPNSPSSCILTSLYRAQGMARAGVKRREAVALVVLSDFREACPDFGFNFERQLPDSIGVLPVQSDLSGLSRVILLRVQTSGAVAVQDETHLLGLWIAILKRWGVDTAAMEITPDFPATLLAEG